MKILLCTLSFGVNYTKDYTLRMIEDVLKMSNIEFYITTDCREIIENNFPNNPRIHITDIKREDLTIRLFTTHTKSGDDFNFNMRYISLLPVTDIDDSIVIFTDCDNSFDWWDENEVLNFINEKYSEGYDFFAPRNDYKWKMFMSNYNTVKIRTDGIFWHKIYNYDLDKTPKPEWDDAPLPAEYLLIFVNNNGKLKKFTEQWKWFHDYLCNKEYNEGTWAEGFEIGVSSLVAGFKPYDIGWNNPLWSKIFTANGYKTGPRGGIYHATEK
jgi:hypothetical protein